MKDSMTEGQKAQQLVTKVNVKNVMFILIGMIIILLLIQLQNNITMYVKHVSKRHIKNEFYRTCI
jgi:hypothetical protein